jgi:hypothetical protein
VLCAEFRIDWHGPHRRRRQSPVSFAKGAFGLQRWQDSIGIKLCSDASGCRRRFRMSTHP